MEIGPVIDPSIPISYREYLERLTERMSDISRKMVEFQNTKQLEQAMRSKEKLRKQPLFAPRQLVYLWMPAATDLDTKTRGFKVSYVGPLRVETLLDKNHVTLSDMQGRLIQGVYNIKRIKPACIRSDDGPIGTTDELAEKVGAPSESTREVTPPPVGQVAIVSAMSATGTKPSRSKNEKDEWDLRRVPRSPHPSA